MSLSELTPEHAAEAERLYQHLRPVAYASVEATGLGIQGPRGRRPTGGWPGWASSSTPGLTAATRPPEPIHRRPATRPG
ncbi:hypothetical protein [Tautonia marina]|uniref:hypothetical protein n=1 Tax=Tautonia marina TaxID=2653855 RepID=UPI00126089E4|nr:hypothetical protein [Tautonia marina]